MRRFQQKINQQKLISVNTEKKDFFILSLKIVFENLDLVKSYDKTNPNNFVYSL